MYRDLMEYIKENGGATVNAETMRVENIEVGFAVAYTNFYCDADNYPVIELIESELKNKHNASYIGYWLHEGKLYIDAVTIKMLQKDAMAFAKRHDQKAIWDFLNKREVFV